MASTLEEVAELAGVSRSTVSRVVNDSPHVREATREKVWKAVNASGYQPHAAARSLVTNRTRIIGLLIPEAVTTLFSDPFFLMLIQGIAGACNHHHYHLMLSVFSDREDGEDPYRRVVGSGYLDGVVIASTTLDDPLIPRLLQDRIPFVSVGRYPDHQVSYVDVDNIGGARKAVDHLVDAGRQRVATITGPQRMIAGWDRLTGYREALASHELPGDDSLVAEGDFTEEGGRVAMQRLLPHNPDAVFVASDTMALGALRALHETGVRVPEDIAMVGFDDMPYAATATPPLTTLRQPIQRIGSLALEALLDTVENGLDPVRRTIVPTELVVRASCGAG
ncbi:MAG: LacI family DNA-binding transcriptional regulator [Anaerolineae bacterium]|nr:LacI family DNA-binding transcriptional regulator [Anaerolineae bacterium]